jgi:serine/threonine-protein kinase
MNDRDRWNRMQDLFAAALETPPADREAYLDRIADPEMAAEVRALLRAHEHSGRLDRLADVLGPPAPPDAGLDDPLPAPSRVGPYALLRPIAHGGMGSVYLAQRADGQASYQVAIKLLRRDLDSAEARRRFLAERQILARLIHPHIARLLDAGLTPDDRPYFVMEYVEGEPIDGYADARHATVNERLELFRTVCAAVQHAHRSLVVHRDLKPANILVTGDGAVKLLDFGIAKALDPEAFPESGRTETGLRLMTPEYASPEQLRGEPVTTASDVYQLGLLLYVLLAGRRPRLVGPPGAPGMVTREVTRPSVAVARGTAAPSGNDDPTADQPAAVAGARGTSPERLRRALRGDLDNIVLRALREEPERRYASVEQLAEDVRRHQVGLPVIARPETWSYVAGKFVKRHRVGVALSTAIAALLVIFAAGMTVQSGRVARERDRAQQVSGLLLDVFRSASPEVARGESITVIQVLDRGTERVRASLGDQPALRATMLLTLSDVYEILGKNQRAAAMAGEALPLNLRSRGPDDPETIENLVRLSKLLAWQGSIDSALLLAERALQLSRRRFGRASLTRARALNAYGLVLHLKGDVARAGPAMEEAVAMLRTRGDSGRRELAAALLNLGWVEENRGRLDSAEARVRESLAIRRRLLSHLDPYLVNTVSALAAILLKLGRVDEGETLAGEATAMADSIYPVGHPQRAGMAALHARALDQAGHAPAAEQRYREALAAARGAYGERSLAAAQMLNDLGLLLNRRGDARGAEASLCEAASIFAERRGPADPWTAVVQASLAEVLVPQGRLVEADSIFRGAIPTLERTLGPGDTRLAIPLRNHGVVLMMMGRGADAEPLLRRSLAIERAANRGPVQLAMSQASLGICLVERGLLTEAEPLLLAAHEVFTSTRSGGPVGLYTMNALARLYDRLGRPGDAARFRPAGPDR